MSSVQRYRTLIHYLTQIYSAKDSVARTDSMREGLDCIMTKIAPGSSSDWQIVLHDVRRLLNVWEAKETDDVAKSVVLQIVDMLKEFSQPALSLRVEKNPVISHVVDYPLVDARISLKVEEKEKEKEKEDAEEEEEEEEEDAEEEEEDAEEEEDVPEVDVPGPEDVPVSDESEEESEEDVPAPPEAEMEVEQITIRGKTYWHDAASGKLFAVVDDDDVGDEVGILVNGKMTALVRE